MSLRDALSVLPTWPVAVVAPLVIVFVLGLYFVNQYRDCSRQRSLREAFAAAVAQHVREEAEPLRLATAMPFPWDRVRVLPNYRPDVRTRDCPFGWDWSRREREEIASRGELTLLVFSLAGTLVGHIEYRAERAQLRDIGVALNRETAVFVRQGGGGEPGGVLLAPEAEGLLTPR